MSATSFIDEDETLKRECDLEFWKYVRLQMLWLFIVGFLCAIYEVLMGLIGVAVVDNPSWDYLFGFHCRRDIHSDSVWSDPREPLGEIF